MSSIYKQPVRDEDSEELLGYISDTSGSWAAETIFGYVIGRSSSERDARELVVNQAAESMKALWRYFDKDDNDWHPCVIAEAYENRVVVTRTNELGYLTPEVFKRVTIKSPTETTLQLA